MKTKKEKTYTLHLTIPELGLIDSALFRTFQDDDGWTPEFEGDLELLRNIDKQLTKILG